MTPIYATSTYAQAEPGRAQGLRVRAQPQPDALRASSAASPTSKAARTASPSPRAWRRSRRCSSCSTPARTSSRWTTSTAARFRLFERVRRRSAGLDFTFVDLTDLAGARGGDPAGDASWSGSRRRPIRCCKLVDLDGDRRRSRKARGIAARSPTTPSPAPGSSARSSSASTSSCTRRPSTSTAIPTWSAASLVVGDNAELARAARLPAERGRRDRRARSTASSRCAA